MSLPRACFSDELLQEILASSPDGLSEYELLNSLRQKGQTGLPENFSDHLVLFRTHFLLFHSLYRLRDRLWRAQQAHLEIGPLSIRLLPYSRAEAGLAAHDPLREYYLDLTQLELMTEQRVDELLAGFWIRLQNSDQRAGALAELGLQDPVDDATIKQRYRELAMRHHPDRGGEQETLQTINAAMSVLAKR